MVAYRPLNHLLLLQRITQIKSCQSCAAEAFFGMDSSPNFGVHFPIDSLQLTVNQLLFSRGKPQSPLLCTHWVPVSPHYSRQPTPTHPLHHPCGISSAHLSPNCRLIKYFPDFTENTANSSFIPSFFLVVIEK